MLYHWLSIYCQEGNFDEVRPMKEADRLAALHDLQILDSEPEAEFDAIVNAAAMVCGVPMCLISLFDTDRHWFKANVGLSDYSEITRGAAICDVTILQADLVEVPDCLQDDRFAQSPMVTGEPNVRFYAGHPLTLGDGSRVGCLCVLDSKPGRLTKAQRDVLRQLSLAASHALESRRTARALIASESRYRALVMQQSSELARVGGWELNLLTEQVTWSANTCLIHGLPVDYQPQRDTATGFYTPDSRKQIRNALDNLIYNNIALDMELQLVRADGRACWVRVVGDADRVDGKAVRLRGSIKDIDESIRQRLALESAHERMRIATDSGDVGVWEWDVSANTLEWTPQMFKLYGIPATDELLDFQVWVERLNPDDRASVLASVDESVKDSDNLECEFRILWPDGSIRHLHSFAHVKRDEAGQAVKLVGVTWDVTPLRRLASELAEQHELLRVTMQSIDDAVITVDTQGKITWLNPSAELLTGWSCKKAVGKALDQVYGIVHEISGLPLENSVSECLCTGIRVNRNRDLVLISPEGLEYSVEDSVAPIRDSLGQLLGAVLVCRDVSEQRHLAQVMMHRATHDELTQVFNRSEFETRLRKLISRLQQVSGNHAMMFIDLDQFKLVNDACGHSVGDQLLREMAGMLRQSLREHDILARLGGDEFGVILHDCTVEQARNIAQGICDTMDDFRFNHGARRFRIGASIGLVPLDAQWNSLSAIMKAADTSCYAAKDAGRNRVHVWFDSDHAMRIRRGDMQWAGRLEQSLDDNRFELHVQQLVSLGIEAPGLNAEVLIRLRDDAGELILPSAFLPAAERFHLATRIDRWVLQNTIEQLSQLPDLSGIELLWINLSGQSIGDRDFQRDALQMLNEAGRDISQRICLEVTETAAVTDIPGAAGFMDELRALQVRTALDDFGAGASSFGYLKSLPVDVLKIDGQFISTIIDDPLAAAAVRCFVDVARVVGLQTVAEHVENAEVLERVRTLGVDFAQGFLLHKPEPIRHVLGACSAITNKVEKRLWKGQ